MRKDASVGVDLYGRDISASKALKSVGTSAEKLGHKLNDMSNRVIKGMAVAAAAAGALAVKIGVDAVKAAAEDSKSVALLEKQLKNSVGATREQIAAVEDYISVQQKRVGLDDGKLRAAFGTLTRATGNVTKSQKMMNDALDISAMTGKDVGTVSLALAKAYTGNFGALTRMGISIDKATLKTKDYDKIMSVLRQNTKGFADKEAATFDGRVRIMRVRLDEVKESLGYALLPIVERFAKYLGDELIPKLEKWIDANGPQVRKAFEDSIPKVQTFIEKLMNLGTWVSENKDGLATVAKHLAAIVVAIKAAAAVTKTIAAINLLIGAYKALKLMAAGAVVAQAAATGGVSLGPALAAALTAAAAFGVTEFALNGGFEGGKKSANVAGSGGAGNGRFAFGNPGAALAGGGNVTINVQGSVISEGDLVTKVRNAITQANRRQGADVTVTGLGKK